MFRLSKTFIKYLIMLQLSVVLSGVLLSCEEFPYEKTVRIVSADFQLFIEPTSENLYGTALYQIRNNHQDPIQEVHFVSYEPIEITSIFINGKKSIFKNKPENSYSIIRIPIDPLEPNQTLNIQASFQLNHWTNEKGFIFQSNQVYFSPEKLWIPLPLTDLPEFHFTAEITNSIDFYPVIGAELKEESTNSGYRITRWESQWEQVLLSGYLFLNTIPRYHENNQIYVYCDNPVYSKRISSYAQELLNRMRTDFTNYPYTQFHLIVSSNSGRFLEPYLEGEYLANVLLLSPSLIPETNSPEIGETSPIPFYHAENQSDLLLYRTLAHEISHGIYGTMIRFDKDHRLFLESITEYHGNRLIENLHPGLGQKLIEMKRLEMIRHQFFPYLSEPYHRFIYGLNTFQCVFGLSGTRRYHDFTAILTEKYPNIEITPDDVFESAQQYNETKYSEFITNSEAIIFSDYMKLFQSENLKLFQSGLTISNSLYSAETKLSNAVPPDIAESNFSVNQYQLRRYFYRHNLPVSSPVLISDGTNHFNKLIPQNKSYFSYYQLNVSSTADFSNYCSPLLSYSGSGLMSFSDSRISNTVNLIRNLSTNQLLAEQLARDFTDADRQEIFPGLSGDWSYLPHYLSQDQTQDSFHDQQSRDLKLSVDKVSKYDEYLLIYAYHSFGDQPSGYRLYLTSSGSVSNIMVMDIRQIP